MPTNDVYGEFPRRSVQGSINDLGDNTNTVVKCALLDSNHTPATDSNTTWGDVSANEVSGTNYTSTGTELTNKTVSQSGGQTVFDADDAVWTDSTITADYAVVYEEGTGTLICLITFDSTETSENGEFRVEFDSAGILDFNA